MTDFNALVIFAAVVEAKSFSEAARRPKNAARKRQPPRRGPRAPARRASARTLNAQPASHRSRYGGSGTRAAQLRICEAVDNIVSNHQANVSGLLRLSAPPNVSDSLLSPLISAFQASYPNVRVQALVTERHVDHIADGVDLAFRVGALRDSSLVARKILTFRHQLVATPEYLKKYKPPKTHRICCLTG